MLFETMGNPNDPAVLFFHAMGVVGASSEPIAKELCDRYFGILPTSSVYCLGQKYRGKAQEVCEINAFLKEKHVHSLSLVVASSLGADLATAFLSGTDVRIDHVYFDGGQFARISKLTRRLMTPFLYCALKSISLTHGKTLGKLLWCDDEAIKPYFIAASSALCWGNLRRQLADSLEAKPYVPLPVSLQKHTYFAFGSAEEHYKYREAVKRAYPFAKYPVFSGYNHMQFQIRSPKDFAQMLCCIIERDELPKLPFIKEDV